jgi:NAD dependent epimerase/dehydratase family enzyme
MGTKSSWFSLKLLFGEMSVIILEGSRVDNDKIKKAGFVFQYDTIDEALKSLIQKK